MLNVAESVSANVATFRNDKRPGLNPYAIYTIIGCITFLYLIKCIKTSITIALQKNSYAEIVRIACKINVFDK